MTNEEKASFHIQLKTLEKINRIEADMSALKEAMILLLKENKAFSYADDDPAAYLNSISDKFLGETQPGVELIKKQLEL